MSAQVAIDARWLHDNYDEERSPQFLPAERVRQVCRHALMASRIPALEARIDVLQAANRSMADEVRVLRQRATRE